jgi:hypothetical protein
VEFQWAVGSRSSLTQASCAALGTLLNLSMPLFPHLQWEN